MKKLFLTIGLILSLTASTAAVAGGSCYTPKEFEAEQGLRIESELMVIALTCMKMPHQSDLFDKYRDFTAKNQGILSEYESNMISFYRLNGAANPEGSLHTLRTTLANKISQDAVASTTGFCNAYIPEMSQALAMDSTKLHRWAQHVWPQKPASLPMCTKS